MLKVVVFENEQERAKEVAVPALVETCNGVLDNLARGRNARLGIGNAFIERERYANGDVFFVQLRLVHDSYPASVGLQFSNVDGGAKWYFVPGRGPQRVPSADELDEVVDAICLITEHFAVSGWKDKLDGSIGILKRIHKVFS